MQRSRWCVVQGWWYARRPGTGDPPPPPPPGLPRRWLLLLGALRSLALSPSDGAGQGPFAARDLLRDRPNAHMTPPPPLGGVHQKGRDHRGGPRGG